MKKYIPVLLCGMLLGGCANKNWLDAYSTQREAARHKIEQETLRMEYQITEKLAAERAEREKDQAEWDALAEAAKKAEAERTARLEEISQRSEEEARLKEMARQAERDRLAKLPCPRIGMTKAQALKSCWGRPESVNRTITAQSVTEQWVYGYSSYLYFTNGRLTAIQD